VIFSESAETQTMEIQRELPFFPRDNASVRVDIFISKFILNALPYLFSKMMFDPLCWWVKVVDW
jgi:hypothetical protein|tara:strand:- start:222 stop:413 length:192 start_codon:yes stop_codon:yes gene_type:complete